MNRYGLLLALMVTLTACHTKTKKTTATSKQMTTAMDTTTAIRNLEIAFFQHPTASTGLDLANLYAATKDKRAVILCDSILAHDSTKEFTDAVFIKGVYYFNIDDSAHAIQQFEECIRRDWKYTEAYIEKGILFYNRKNYPAALKTFELATKVSNTYPDAYFWLARNYEAMGNKELALDNYYRALSLDKNFTEAADGIKRLNH